MSRTPLPLHVDDISAMARSLRGQLSQCENTPGHVELLNMLARAGGFKNFQHFRGAAGMQAEEPSGFARPEAREKPAEQAVDAARLKRVARYFNPAGQLIRWPGKYSHQEPCLWVLWSKLPANQDMAETQVNDLLRGWHLFGDHALLRRELFDRKMLTRTPDGRIYRRIERVPSDEALALFRLLHEKQAA